MLRVGIVGFGFMGKMHFRCYRQRDDVEVAAICDADAGRLKGEGTAGNIAGTEEPIDLTGITLYTDFEKMLAEANLDAVTIALPTYMHAEFTVKALQAGLHVLCEKPMAINVAQCEDMLAAWRKSGKVFQIGHCIRFWPEYAKTREYVMSHEYGEVLSATLRRLTSEPKWSWNNWLTSSEKSGGALMDLHIHDTDYVQFLFGLPAAVHSVGLPAKQGGFDYVATQYVYDDSKVVVAEGGFVRSAGFGFEMSFLVSLENATIVYDCTRDPAFRVCPTNGEVFVPQVAPGDGYSLEIEHFVKKITGKQVPEIITPEQSLSSIKLILAENQSASSKKEVRIQWSNVLTGR